MTHNSGKIHAKIATVFLRCFLLKKSIHPNWPNKSENIRVRAASAENSTTNEPNKKNVFAQGPNESVYIFERVSIIWNPPGTSPRL